MGFALIWHIWWLVVVAFLGAFATFVVFAWRDRTEDLIPADEVARIDRANRSCPQRGTRADAARANERQRCRRIAGHDVRIAEHAARDVVSKRIIVGYGFWIFLLSDIIMFSAFFATYAVLSGRNGGRPQREGPVPPQHRRDRDGVPAAVQLHLRRREHRRHGRTTTLMYYGGMAVTFVLGAGFLFLEMHEFAGMVATAPDRRAARSCRRSSRWSAATGCT